MANISQISEMYEGKLHSPKHPNKEVKNTFSYFQQIADGTQGRKCDKLYKVIKQYGQPVTRKMASKLTGFEINCITQYVKILILEGKLLESKEKRKCKVTKNLAYYLKLAEVKPIQTKLDI